jgi:hypothetical protein
MLLADQRQGRRVRGKSATRPFFPLAVALWSPYGGHIVTRDRKEVISLIGTKIQTQEYSAPRIADYGDLAQLTAGCQGSPADFQGQNNSLTAVNSRGNCISTP